MHPELFDRLYDDWSTLERFQRTRGVLRLMSTVIYALWQANDAYPLIMPATVPLGDPTGLRRPDPVPGRLLEVDHRLRR